MHDDSLSPWQRDHAFLGQTHGRNEGRTRAVMVFTVAMMVVEIGAGTVFRSMALVADGWHMASHAVALGVAAFAYAYARRHVDNPTYSFGTGKVGDLAAFASALVLGVIGVIMVLESVERLITPVPIAFDQAIYIATLGLAVNVVSALMLGGEHSHGHEGHSHASHDHAGHDHAAPGHKAHDHEAHGHDAHAQATPEQQHHRDHNFRATYIHILADAVTSLLAIVALAAGRFLGWVWLDPIMGIVGAAVIGRWAWTLMGTAGRILLDAAPSPQLCASLRAAIEADADNRVADLHVWRLGPGHLAAVLTVVTHQPRPPAYYKSLLAGIPSLSHVTVEVEHCQEPAPRAA